MMTLSTDITPNKVSETDTQVSDNTLEVAEKKFLTTNGWITPSEFRLFRSMGVKLKKVNLKNKNVFQLRNMARRYRAIRDEIQKEYLRRSCKKITVKIPLNKLNKQ